MTDSHTDEEIHAIQLRAIERMPQVGGAVAARPAFVQSPSRGSMDWLQDFKLTEKEVAQLSAPNWAYPGIIAEGHVLAVVARPGSGKTTIFFDIACELAAQNDYRVCYVHADTAPGDAGFYIERAKECGVDYLTPELKSGGKTMRDVVENLRVMVAQGKRLDKWIFVFDTLKKMCNVINKGSLRDMMQLMRQLSGLGATPILLGHLNKNRDATGKPIFEGTGDLENDADDMIYLAAEEQDDKSLLVSSICKPSDGQGKKRCDMQDFTWLIEKDRTVVCQDEYIDVGARVKVRDQFATDADDIALALSFMDQPINQRDLIDKLKDKGVTRRNAQTLLKRYAGGQNIQWQRHQGGVSNRVTYRRNN